VSRCFLNPSHAPPSLSIQPEQLHHQPEQPHHQPDPSLFFLLAERFYLRKNINHLIDPSTQQQQQQPQQQQQQQEEEEEEEHTQYADSQLKPLHLLLSGLPLRALVSYGLFVWLLFVYLFV